MVNIIHKFNENINYNCYALLVACEPNTFSAVEESSCTPCPLGQYQPLVGSKSCLVCKYPLQDPQCMRELVSIISKKEFEVV